MMIGEKDMLAQVHQGTALKAKLFRGFSDTSRLAILEKLRAGPLTVGALVEKTGLSQSNVSNHLGCLRDCGLVTCSQQDAISPTS
jgi:DNA-binding transcriptional ArsR family regulator